MVVDCVFQRGRIVDSPPLCAALNIYDYRFHTMPETSYYGGIHSIAKDSIGRIWFSGYDALFMYNGSAFVRMDDLVTGLSPSSYWNYGQVVTDRRGGLYAPGQERALAEIKHIGPVKRQTHRAQEKPCAVCLALPMIVPET